MLVKYLDHISMALVASNTVGLHQWPARKAVHLPFSSRHHGCQKLLKSWYSPGFSVWNMNIFFNDATTALFIVVLVSVELIPNPPISSSGCRNRPSNVPMKLPKLYP